VDAPVGVSLATFSMKCKIFRSLLRFDLSLTGKYILCASLALEISVPASKMLVRGEIESEELESEAIIEDVAVEEGRVPAHLVVWIPAHRGYRCSLLPGSGLQLPHRGCLVLTEVCGLFLLLDSLCRGASGLNYEKRKLWVGLE
jgi:hypothetical protein